MITIVVASYNHEKYIAACLEACNDIPVEDKKMIIIDDASADQTCAVIESFIRQKGIEKDVTFIRKEKNTGLISSLVTVVPMVTTPFVYFTASDDIPVAEGIGKLVAMLQSDGSADFAIGGANNFYEDGSFKPVYDQRHELFFDLPVELQRKSLYLDYPQPMLFQSSVFRMACIREVGGWDPDVKLDDYSMFIKLFENSYRKRQKVIFTPGILCSLYRHHATNTYKNTIRQYLMVSETLRRYCPGNLLDNAIGKVGGFYLLSALKSGNPKAAFYILSRQKPRSLRYMVLESCRLIYKKAIAR